MSRLWVIAYDIEDDGARRRVFEYLTDHGMRVQYSVFECRLSEDERTGLWAGINAELGETDSVRWYPLCERCQDKVGCMGAGTTAQEEEGFYLA
jgi:CRISPR-associated protein Cas2